MRDQSILSILTLCLGLPLAFAGDDQTTQPGHETELLANTPQLIF